MFVLSRQDSAAFRVIATLVTVALVMWGIGLHAGKAQAANITDVKDTLSTSEPSVGSNHTIEFVTPTGVASGGETIEVTFPGGFNLGSVVEGDIDLAVNGSDEDISGTDWSVAVGANDITFTSVAGSVPAGGTTTITVGTNASGGSNQIVNPTTGSYELSITAGPSDSGHTRVAIVDTVSVTASVNTQFDFTVSGFATAGTAVNGTSTTGTSTATALPFGSLTAGDIETLAQRLNVTTNAVNGYVVTVETDQQLLSSTGADIDGFQDGAYTNTPSAWAAPSNDINDEDTWGHWGLTSEDSDLNGDEFGSDLWVSASTTPREIMAHGGPSDGATADIGSTTVGYQVEISALQEAGDDYNATLTYIATPTF